MYHREAHSGSSPDYWEENWETVSFEQAVRFSAIDPLRPLFEKYLHSDSLMLEGGCGMGNYLSYYAGRGYNVVGLDFAIKALRILHGRQPKLKLTCGDVSRLPFADETFDLYYSGGVVEHFERGAAGSLSEARRVLKKDGVLLISVPYQSPLRKVLSPLKKREWQQVEKAAAENNNAFGDRKFFQYAYTRREFIAMLSNEGLTVTQTQGYAVLWGLYDIPFLGTGNTDEFASRPTSSDEQVTVDIKPLVADREISMIKRLVVSEDSTVPILGTGVRFMRWAAPNILMSVVPRADKIDRYAPLSYFL